METNTYYNAKPSNISNLGKVESHRKAFRLESAYIVQPLGLPTLIRDQKPNEIMIQGCRGFYFLRTEKRKLWIAEYFGTQGLKDLELHLGKKDAIASCKEKLS